MLLKFNPLEQTVTAQYISIQGEQSFPLQSN